ncbi:hypothetical protein V8G54_024204 [Vigna mungo]|uniref:Uncharacterized protein n=1 Tax=Vigna mungo TaxID=3915 RepID=A0AAQ3N568_VIGMU
MDVASKNLTRGLPNWGNLPLHLRHNFDLPSYTIRSQQHEKGTITLLQMTMMMQGRMSRLARILRVEGGVDGGWHHCRGACEMKGLSQHSRFEISPVCGSRLVGTNLVCVSGTVFATRVARVFWICLSFRTHEEEERTPLFGFFTSEEWRCLFDLRLELLYDWSDGAQDANP